MPVRPRLSTFDGAQYVVRPHFIGDGLGLAHKLCRTLKKSVWPGALFSREARESFP
jgi:hypothetical protein